MQLFHENLHISITKLYVLTNYIDILFNYNIYFMKTNLFIIVFYKKFLYQMQR